MLPIQDYVIFTVSGGKKLAAGGITGIIVTDREQPSKNPAEQSLRGIDFSNSRAASEFAARSKPCLCDER
jgi:hypothetical protein